MCVMKKQKKKTRNNKTVNASENVGKKGESRTQTRGIFQRCWEVFRQSDHLEHFGKMTDYFERLASYCFFFFSFFDKDHSECCPQLNFFTKQVANRWISISRSQ